MSILLNKFLDALVSKHGWELHKASELSDQGRHNDAHDHLVKANAIQDAIMLGHEFIQHELDLVTSGRKPT